MPLLNQVARAEVDARYPGKPTSAPMLRMDQHAQAGAVSARRKEGVSFRLGGNTPQREGSDLLDKLKGASVV